MLQNNLSKSLNLSKYAHRNGILALNRQNTYYRTYASKTNPETKPENKTIEGIKDPQILSLNKIKNPITFKKYGSIFRKVFNPLIPQYQSVEIGRNVYSKCRERVKFNELESFWIKECNMPPTFQTWFSVSMIYVWLSMVRLRMEENSSVYKQQLVDNFFTEAEERIKKSGISSGKIVNDSLKDLTANYLGVVMAFDEGFIKSDAILAGAIWRNTLSNCESTESLYKVVYYVRKQLSMLDNTSSQDFIQGKFSFDPISVVNK
ncbi:hypothetical protein BB559_004023 [Furculomyces boomerangus]|uniref:Ubiquinol-cytochrome c chaperone domain-containing protein n=2 Tax=Harpellales TaxID=61421 RepID=A0A2T9YHD9_9FUNG|nr:hypothetical protein BB559_004023 [Furculomyces boomerangus]PVZ98023.1 hypothetical protein BB558_005958 [Smittium angustum]PVZ98165.1 hypothetical protein BB558_005836 [Smittium angustum]